jgi:DNA-binding transcriptional LysR family regulator
VFVRTIEHGTFAAAAADLRLTPSAVSKLIRRLEARLGVRLINRTTRKLSLTAEGEAYFQSGRQLIAAVDGLEQEVAASASRPRGLLRINTPVSLGVHHLAPALIEFHWPFKTADGGMEHVEVAATFASDSLQCILQLALQGAGIARLADFLVADAIRAGDLVPVLVGQHVAERASVFAMFAPGTQKIPKVRVFLDFLVERFQHQPWRLGRGESEAYALRRPG